MRRTSFRGFREEGHRFFLNVALHPQPIVLAAKSGDLYRRVQGGMRGRRRRVGAQRRSRIPPSTPTAPIAKHRRRDAQFPCDLRQRPTAARQQGYCLPLELIGKLTTSLAHSTPSRSSSELSKGVHQFAGGSVTDLPSRPRVMPADCLAVVEERGDWLAKLPAQLTASLRRLALVDLRALRMYLEDDSLSLRGDGLRQL